MRLIQRTRIESPLPHVAGRRMLGIPIRRVASMGLFERLREGLWGLRNRDQVHVIRHEAVAQQRESGKLRILAQQLEVSKTLGIAGKNHLSRVPSLRNMMGNVGDPYPRQPSDLEKLTGMTHSANSNNLELAS